MTHKPADSLIEEIDVAIDIVHDYSKKLEYYKLDASEIECVLVALTACRTRLSTPVQYDEKLIEGKHFNYRDEYATGAYIEKKIKAEFKDRVLGWKEVLTILDSTIPPVIEGGLEERYKEVLKIFRLADTDDCAAYKYYKALYPEDTVKILTTLTALHDELGRVKAENEALKGAGNMFCKKCKGIIYGLRCVHCGYDNSTTADKANLTP